MIVVEEADFELDRGNNRRRIVEDQMLQVIQAYKYEHILGTGAINSFMNPQR